MSVPLPTHASTPPAIVLSAHARHTHLPLACLQPVSNQSPTSPITRLNVHLPLIYSSFRGLRENLILRDHPLIPWMKESDSTECLSCCQPFSSAVPQPFPLPSSPHGPGSILCAALPDSLLSILHLFIQTN